MVFSGQIDAIWRDAKLSPMPHSRRPDRSRSRLRPAHFLLAGLLVCLSACERRRGSTRAESTGALPAGAVDSAAAHRRDSGWNPAAGPVLLVQGSRRDEAVVLLPSPNDSDAVATLDSASLSAAPVVLLGRGGTRLSAQLGDPPNDADEDCERWPLQSVTGASDAATWAVGFVAGRVAGVSLDSVDALPQRDSMALVAEASRLASSPAISTARAFDGLRFTVHDIRRFAAAPGIQAIAAHVIRRVNEEANPQEEQTLLIAERDSGATSGPYQLAYAERSNGREEKVAIPEVVAALRLGGSPSTSLVVAHDNDDGVVYSLLERTSSRRWRVRWTSAVTRCD